MIQCRRLGHITIETPDLDRMADYYQDVLGLRVVARGSDDFYVTTRVGQIALHVRLGPRPRCSRLSFEVAPNLDLDEAQKALSRAGVPAERRSDVAPGVKQTLSLIDPGDVAIDLFTHWEFGPCADTNGVAPFKLGHAAFIVDDLKKYAAFYGNHLGFRVSDWVEEFFVFMRCGPDHHTVNFLQGSRSSMHHCAFEMKDTAHLIESCDILGRHKLPIIWGPCDTGPVTTSQLTISHLMVWLWNCFLKWTG